MKIAILTTDNREHARDYSAPRPYFGPAPDALLQGFAQLPEAEIHVVSILRQPVPSPPKIAPNIFYHSLHVPKIGWMRTAYQGCIRAARRKLKELRPEIVHGQGTEHDNALCAVFSGFPNVITIHGNMRLIAKVNQAKAFSFLWLAARLETFTLPRSDGIVCITHYTEQAVANLAKRTWVQPNAADGPYFDVDAEPAPGAPPRILCVGLICVRKNQNAFIRSLDGLACKQKFELVFLGNVSAGRPYDDEFLALVRERPWCRHAGFADHEALKKHLQGATLLVLPSLEDNCPMVVLEAMATGVPVVAANVGGVPDLIEEGVTGYFCDPLNPVSMSSAVEKALADANKLREMARIAKKRALERFHPRVVARRHLEIYSEVLREKAKR
jgi:glycosyltransferase involved in cell wall biosynthesis